MRPLGSLNRFLLGVCKHPVAKSIKNLTKIRVSLPTDSVELSAVVRMDCDEIASSSVVRAQNRAMPLKQFESLRDVAFVEIRAVTADNHDFLVTDPCQIFDRVFQPGSERCSLLVVNLAGWRDHTMELWRCEKVNITLCSFPEAKTLHFQEGAENARPATPFAVDVGRGSENEQGPRFH